MSRSNIIALDYGRRRVGVAGCQKDLTIAFSIATLTVNSPEDLLKQLDPILIQRQAEEIVLGLPITLGDKPGTLCAEILSLAQTLKARGLTVHLVDEALSSRQAQTIVRQRGKKPPKEALDRTAAALLLQEYLDGQLPALTADQTARLNLSISSHIP